MISRGGSGGFPRGSRRGWTARPRTSPSSWVDLLDRSAHRLDELGITAPAPFDLERFIRQLRELRGREIVLTPIEVRPDAVTVCGYCLTLAEWDHVFYAQSRSRLHRTHNAVHELAHLVLGHRSVSPLARPGAAATGPALLGPAEELPGYSDRCEDEADAVAAVLLGRWQENAPRSWVAHATLRRGAVRLADAYA